MVQRALERAPHADFRKRLKRIHDEETAIGAEKGAGAQVHEVAGPAASRVIGALDGAKEIGVGWRGFENDRRLVIVVVRKNYVDPVHAEGIALRTGLRPWQTGPRFF